MRWSVDEGGSAQFETVYEAAAGLNRIETMRSKRKPSAAARACDRRPAA
jgi:hypothetical protein